MTELSDFPIRILRQTFHTRKMAIILVLCAILCANALPFDPASIKTVRVGENALQTNADDEAVLMNHLDVGFAIPNEAQAFAANVLDK